MCAMSNLSPVGGRLRTSVITLCAAVRVFSFCEVWAVEPARAHPDTRRLQIKASQKISAVFWVVERTSCVVQINFLPLPDRQMQPEHPRTQVWLLKADGSVIPSKGAPATFGISGVGYTTDSIAYVFPPSAKTEARAAVISIDDDFFVERLF